MRSKEPLETEANPRKLRVYTKRDQLPPGAVEALNRRSEEELNVLADRANQIV